MEKEQNDIQLCRCPWLDTSKADYVEYHDKEWGEPVYDDQKLFEFLSLESAQAELTLEQLNLFSINLMLSNSK